MNEQKDQKRICLYDLGWIRQKGAWLDEFRKFAGREGERLDLATMDKRFRAQIDNGTAYVDADNQKTEESRAAFVRLDTGIVVSREITGDEDRYAIIKFHRNPYGLWAGLDFEFGDIAEPNPEEIEKDRKEDPFYDDIYWKQGWQDQLLELAVDEPWSNEHGPGGRLLPYLRYTYRRLKLEGDKVVGSQDGKYLVFNTGLVTRDNLDPIVAVCTDNAPRKPKWQFNRFVVWSMERADQKDRLLIKRFDERKIPQANWFGDIKKTILSPDSILSEWHDIEDDFAKSHYPSELLEAIARTFGSEDALKNTRALLRMEDANLPSEREMRSGTAAKILKALGSPEDVSMQALEIVKGAFALALRRLAWEVGTAVPMWEPENDGFSFMIPLSFGADPLHADIALRLFPKTDSDGKTIIGYCPKSFLKLKAAYSNARLLRRPEAFWLRDYVERR